MLLKLSSLVLQVHASDNLLRLQVLHHVLEFLAGRLLKFLFTLVESIIDKAVAFYFVNWCHVLESCRLKLTSAACNWYCLYLRTVDNSRAEGRPRLLRLQFLLLLKSAVDDVLN